MLVLIISGGIPQKAPIIYNFCSDEDCNEVIITPCVMHNQASADKFALESFLEHAVPVGDKKRILFAQKVEGVNGTCHAHSIVESCQRYRSYLPDVHSTFFESVKTNPDKSMRVFTYLVALASIVGCRYTKPSTAKLSEVELFSQAARSMVLWVLACQMSANVKDGIRMKTKIKLATNSMYWVSIGFLQAEYEIQTADRLCELSEGYGKSFLPSFVNIVCVYICTVHVYYVFIARVFCFY